MYFYRRKIPNFDFCQLGANTTPSVVAYSDDEIYVGETAVQSATLTANIIHGIFEISGLIPNKNFCKIQIQSDSLADNSMTFLCSQI